VDCENNFILHREREKGGKKENIFLGKGLVGRDKRAELWPSKRKYRFPGMELVNFWNHLSRGSWKLKSGKCGSRKKVRQRRRGMRTKKMALADTRTKTSQRRNILGLHGCAEKKGDENWVEWGLRRTGGQWKEERMLP